MNIKTLKNVDIKNKTILYRAPYDIGTKEVNGEFVLKDNLRIVATIPTLKYLLENNCKIVVLTWVKRPENGYEEKFSTKPHAKELSKLLDLNVKHLNDCIGQSIENEIKKMKPRDVVMLENVRFYKEEFIDDDSFAKKLTQGSEYIVFDGFPQAHRIHSSTTGILRHLPSCAGFYMQDELVSLQKINKKPKKPLTIIIGGAKISDKINAINNLIDKIDHLIVVGGVANVFLKSQGINIGNSIIEDVFVDKAKRKNVDTIELAKDITTKLKDKILIPTDFVIADNVKDTINTKIILNNEKIPTNWKILDIGPNTIENIKNILNNSKTVFWNGPAGLFENDLFSNGTKEIIKTMCNLKNNTYTLISGGDTIEALNKYGNRNDITHISLAGGATFEVLAGKELPVMKYLTI